MICVHFRLKVTTSKGLIMVNSLLKWGVTFLLELGEGIEYKPMDDTWWLIEHYDFLQEVDPPTMEKVSKNRIKYWFHIQ